MDDSPVEPAPVEIPASPPAAPLAHPRIAYRHRLPTRIWHWVNAITVFVMLMSGLMIFNAHPRLYWGQYGANFDHAWINFGPRPFPGWATIPSGYNLAAGADLALRLCLGARRRTDRVPPDKPVEPACAARPRAHSGRAGPEACVAGHQAACAASIPDRRCGAPLQYSAEDQLCRGDLPLSAADDPDRAGHVARRWMRRGRGCSTCSAAASRRARSISSSRRRSLALSSCTW